MPKKASVDDLRAMFADTLCMYNNKPYFIENITDRYFAVCTNLLTQRREEILMDETTFAAPMRRIGMVNIKQSVLYVRRKPVRRYKAGLNKTNTMFEILPAVTYPEGSGETIRALYPLRAVEIADAMFGNYPTIAECIEAFERETAVAMAFDHQFALTVGGKVIYKNLVVGSYKKTATTVYDLVFDEKYQYLISLLDNNHEKSISAP